MIGCHSQDDMRYVFFVCWTGCCQLELFMLLFGVCHVFVGICCVIRSASPVSSWSCSSVTSNSHTHSLEVISASMHVCGVRQREPVCGCVSVCVCVSCVWCASERACVWVCQRERPVCEFVWVCQREPVCVVCVREPVCELCGV